MSNEQSFENMTSDQLFELAKSKQLEEVNREKEAAREQLDALREQRRTLVAEQRKALAAIDSEIRKLGGKTKGRSGAGRSGGSVTKTVLEIVSNGEITTKEINAKLSEQGIEANNLSQMLAYLKRQGKVVSPRRSVYAPA